MKSLLLRAIGQIAAERDMPEDVVRRAIEAALSSVYRRDAKVAGRDVAVDIDGKGDSVVVSIGRRVAEPDEIAEMEADEQSRFVSLADAQSKDSKLKVGDFIVEDSLDPDLGRIMVQTTKQMIIHNLHEMEQGMVYEQFKSLEGKMVVGVVSHADASNVMVTIDKTTAVMPRYEQISNEWYGVGRSLKVFISKVERSQRNMGIVVSRSHPALLRCLLEQEVPEILSGEIEIKVIAREAGLRSKVAVYAEDKKLDPVGTCIGLRGVRVQNIVNEIGGEKVDIIKWSPDTAQFIMNSLNPATVEEIRFDEAQREAKVYIANSSLSPAIGHEGQNVRLASKLTNWSLNILSLDELDREVKPDKPETAKSAKKAEATKTDKKAAPAKAEEELDVSALQEELKELEQIEEDYKAQKEAETEKAEEAVLDLEAEGLFVTPDEQQQDDAVIRFAEDIREAQSEAETSKKETRPTRTKKKKIRR